MHSPYCNIAGTRFSTHSQPANFTTSCFSNIMSISCSNCEQERIKGRKETNICTFCNLCFRENCAILIPLILPKSEYCDHDIPHISVKEARSNIIMIHTT